MSQPYPNQPNQPNQQPGGQAPMGQLVLKLRKPFGLGSATMMTPTVTIDGYPAPVRWGQNAFPVVPGHHQLSAATTYLWRFGAAEQAVDVAPGQSVEVHYSGPLITFMSGRIGFEEQPRPGLVAFWAILAIPVVLLLILLVAIIATS
ncbi:MAG TPA: hypothetical protein VIT20_11270 [Propionibacteriaceae bacterium]